MQRFAIKFALEVRTGPPRGHREGSEFGRIIEVQSLAIAEKIAEAMIGEEVFAWQYLSKVLSVTSTQEKPFISPLCTSYCVWERTLQRLGLTGTGETVQFLHYQTARPAITSGIVFTPDQINHVLSCTLRLQSDRS